MEQRDARERQANSTNSNGTPSAAHAAERQPRREQTALARQHADDQGSHFASLLSAIIT